MKEKGRAISFLGWKLLWWVEQVGLDLLGLTLLSPEKGHR